MSYEYKPGFLDYAKALFITVPEKNDYINVGGRAIVLALLAVWGFFFIIHPVDPDFMMGSFMHKVNLPFHEAGHMIFRIFGRFIGVLGGSLMQLLMPLIVTAVFILKTRDAVGASVGLWWTGQSLMDLAPYIGDARSLTLPLLGGVTGRQVMDYHDWEYILSELGIIAWDRALAGLAHWTGAVLMVIAISWGGYVAYLQFKSLEDSDRP